MSKQETDVLPFELQNPKGPPTCGEIFQEAREKKGLSIDEVAERLHLAKRVIVGLEADDYKDIPDLIYAKGYVRAYARLLSLDTEKMKQAFTALPWQGKKGVSADELASSHPVLTRDPLRFSRGRASRKWIFRLFLLLVVCVIAASVRDYYHHHEKHRPPLSKTTVVVHPVSTAVQSAVEQDNRAKITAYNGVDT